MEVKIPIAVGDMATWKARVNGYDRVGVVMALVPPGESAMEHIPISTRKNHIKFKTDISKLHRALVRVYAYGMYHYYCPNIMCLRCVQDGA